MKKLLSSPKSKAKTLKSKKLIKKQKPGVRSSLKMGNISLSEKVISQLVNLYGVRTFCLCPGGRNAPLVKVLSKAKGIKILTFFEERSATFFALGRCRREKSPVAVVTTSGTAVAELLPAVIEAYYAEIPLVLITADRPSTYRGTGAPQSIEQVGIFSHYVKQTIDIEKHLNTKITWQQKTPLHINISFDEPLIDKPVSSLSFAQKTSANHPFNRWTSGISIETNRIGNIKDIENFFSQFKKPLFILGETPEILKKDIEKILLNFRQPIYAETLSGLRESKKLSPFILKSGERILHWMVLNQKIDSVVRIGRTPCARFWKDLENTYSQLPVLSVSDQAYTGLSRKNKLVSFSVFFQWFKQLLLPVFKKSPPSLLRVKKEIRVKDEKEYHFLNRLWVKHPLSELALIKQFSKKIPKKSLLFLGNSLPIREWGWVADYQEDRELKYASNRGANGIDGLLSTFFGLSCPGRQNWCLIGDLSSLYDLSAPWALNQLDPQTECFIVVVNNKGGQIFSPLFSDKIFLNEHNLHFKKWAEMWKMNYYHLRKWPKKLSFTSPAIIELEVNPSSTEKFYKALKGGF